ncbi:MAG: ATP-binding cassette domain-containing protein [Actinobacteria bacterium]|nr:ATP-binding cassette domain-containing protein [Actinomycetota bacterium]
MPTTTPTRPRTRKRPPPEPERTPVIVTQGLTKVYPGHVMAVDDLDLTVFHGEIFGLLGPNGAGKTTTEGMLTTRVIPTSGQAIVGGVDVVAQPAKAKRLIGVVPQTNTLDRSLNVWENLYFHGRYFGMGGKQARTAADRELERFRLADRAKAQVLELSGGMAQRLMVARAILHSPAILFLDEPTAGLDPQSRLALWDILQELHDAGQTILLSTHYMEEADQLCHRVAIMDHGRILALDTPARLKESLDAGAEIKISARGDLEGLVTALKRLSGSRDVTLVDKTVRVTLAKRERALPRVIAAAEKAGYPITDISVDEPTLESVFVQLTGRDLRE